MAPQSPRVASNVRSRASVLAQGAGVTTGDDDVGLFPVLALSVFSPLSSSISGPQTHPPTHKPCTTTFFPATSPMNIFLNPACGFFQSGKLDSWCKSGECSENAAPDLKRVMRWSESVYISVIEEEVGWVARRKASVGVTSESKLSVVSLVCARSSYPVIAPTRIDTFY